MLIQCPGCHTTYRIAENAVATSKPTFRCSRCKNVFVLGKGGVKPVRESAESPSPALESRELTFAFPAPEPLAATEANHAEESPESPPAPPAAPNGPTPRETSTDDDRQQQWVLPRDRAVESGFTLTTETALPEFERPTESPFVFSRERQTKSENGAESGAVLNRPLSVTPFLLLCGILLLSCASFTLLYKARPEAIESILKNIPWIGSSIVRNDYLREGIVLQTGLARFQRIQGNREVFLLSGAAVNRNRVKVREVKIEGFIFARDGKVLERQVITVGNAISPKIVRDLSQQEISDLQKQGPVKRFEILPDESAPFSIVFLKSNPAVQSFGYRVLSADEA